jgi:subtilisin family serine protease
MRYRALVWGSLIVILCGETLFGSTASKSVSSAGKVRQYTPGAVIVKLKAALPSGAGQTLHSLDKTAALSAIVQRYAVTKSRQPFATPAKPLAADEEEFSRIYELTVPSPVSIPAMIEELRKNPAVEYAEPKYVHHLDYTPNDPLTSPLWHLVTIHATQAWDITKGDTSVVIGIVDSGTDYTHPDLAANIWTNPGETGLDAQGRDKRTNGIDDDNNGFVDDWHGWDFIGNNATNGSPNNDPNYKGGNDHGTHTAGIASAVTNNGIGIASIGFKTKLMITKHGVDVAGDNSIYDGDDGILYCINNGASIVSCSWGGSGSSQYEQDIIKYGLKKNVLIVAAAGNGGDDNLGDDIAVEPEFPGAFPGVLNVGATDPSDRLPNFSNYGAPPGFKVFAPGLSVYSTIPNNKYTSYSGTSMSTPMAAGLAALVKAQHPTWTAAQIMFQLCGTADPIDGSNSALIGKLGFGRINAFRAVTETVPPMPPEIVFVSASIDDSKRGNGDGILQPGEDADIVVTIENRWGDAANVTATIETSSWAAAITKPSSSYGFVRGITKIDSATRSNAADPFRITVSSQAIPMTIPFTVHIAATNGTTKNYSLTVPVLPSVLLVDDDDGILNVEQYYTSALDTMGVVYERWDHAAKGTPSLDLLSRYKTVIWFTEWNVPTLDSADRAVLTNYLNSGGKKLFMSGEENGWDLCGADGPEFLSSHGASKIFYETYLKGTFLQDDAGTDSVRGISGDAIGDGLAFRRDQPGRGSGQNPDVIAPVGGSSAIFTYVGGAGSQKAAGVKYKGNDYSLVSLSFGGYESITDAAQRSTVMDRVLKYLYGYNTTVTQLPDYPSQPFTVTATVTTADPAPTVELLWSVDGALPYHRIAMTKTNGTASTGAGYTSVITPSPGRLIEYFVLVKTADGYLPYTIHRFAVNIPTAVAAADAAVPLEFSLAQNYPNPFNPSTQIAYSVADARFVSLKIYDALGREVAALVNETKAPGRYTAEWNAAGLTSGVYFCRLTAGTFTSIKKMTLLR